MKYFTVLSLSVLAAASPAALFDADFDSFAEGTIQWDFLDGGILFTNLIRDLPEDPSPFCVEDASGSGLSAGFSSPNVMGIGGYLVGPNVAFGRLKSFEFKLDGPQIEMFSAALDFWTFNLHDAGNTVTLEGYFEGELVDSDSFTPGSFTVAHKRFSLPTDNYDKFIIRSTGTVDNGVVFAVFDNVQVSGTVVPEPVSLLGMAAALGFMAARRKRIASK
jgi:hypothetical protein